MRRTLITLSLSLLVISPLASAQNNNPEVKYRQDVMAAMGNHFAALAAIFTNRVNRPEQLQVHADALAATAALTASLFPEGSEGGSTLPILWQEPERVAEASARVTETTAALAQAAASGDRGALAQAFRAAGESCKGCHDRYQADD